MHKLRVCFRIALIPMSREVLKTGESMYNLLIGLRYIVNRGTASAILKYAITFRSLVLSFLINRTSSHDTATAVSGDVFTVVYLRIYSNSLAWSNQMSH